MKPNQDIRNAVEENGFKLWELAEALGIYDGNLSRNPIFVLDALRYGKSPDGSLLCCSIGIEPPRLPYGRAANYGSIIIPAQVRRCAGCNPTFGG